VVRQMESRLHQTILPINLREFNHGSMSFMHGCDNSHYNRFCDLNHHDSDYPFFASGPFIL